MKEDWNASARPPLMGIQAHAHDVTKDHHAEIKRPKYKERCPQLPAGSHEKAKSAGEVETDSPIKHNDQNLNGQQLRVGQNT